MKKKLLCLTAALLMLTTLAVPVSAYNPGDLVGTYAYTDITTYINNVPIRSFNINWETAVVVEDLADYGFDVVWDPTPGIRNLKVTRNYSKPIKASYIPTASRQRNGQYAGDVLYTDILTFFEGQKVDSFNINGRTIVYVNDIAKFYAQPGTYTYNDATRVLSLNLKSSSVTPSPAPAPAPSVPAALRITSQPKNVSANANSVVQFSVTASGGKAPYTYRWELRRSTDTQWADAGCATSVYSFNATQLILDSDYFFRCVVTDASGQRVISNSASLTAKNTALKAAISLDKYTVAYGGSVKASVAVSGGKAPYSYSWYRYNPANSTWVFLNSMSSSSCTISNITETTYVRCEVSDAGGSRITTDYVTVSVGSLKATAQADKTSVAYGGSANLSVTVSGGTSPYTYTWYKNDSGRWVKSGSSTQNTYILANLTADTTVRCEVADRNGNKVTTNSVTVKVSAAMKATIQANKTSVVSGGSADLTVTVSGGTSPYSYTWYIYNNGQWINMGYTSKGTYTLTNLVSDTTVRCEVVDFAGSKVTTGNATVKVTSSALKATAKADKTSVSSGGGATLTVSVSGGTSPYTYTWYRFVNGQWIVMGYTSANTYPLTGLTEDTTVRCEVSDSRGGRITTNNVTVKVTAALSASAKADKTSVASGGSATVTVSVSGGTSPYNYTWYRYYNGQWTVLGYTASNTYKLTSLTSETTVRCEVSDSKGSRVITNNVTVKVTSAMKATIQADKTSVTSGGSANVSVSVSGGTAPYLYNWYLYYGGQWAYMASTTQNTYPLTIITSDMTVRCEVNDSRGGSVTTSSVTITVKAADMSVSASADTASVSSGGTATVYVSVQGGSYPYTYMWYRYYYGEWINIGTTTLNSCTVKNITETTKIRCEVIDAGGSRKTSNEVTITVETSPSPDDGGEMTVTIPTSAYMVLGGHITSIQTTIKNGKGPYMYIWGYKPQNSNMWDQASETGSSFTGRDLTEPGTYDVYVWVFDTGNNNALAWSNYCTVTVTAP